MRMRSRLAASPRARMSASSVAIATPERATMIIAASSGPSSPTMVQLSMRTVKSLSPPTIAVVCVTTSAPSMSASSITRPMPWIPVK